MCEMSELLRVRVSALTRHSTFGDSQFIHRNRRPPERKNSEYTLKVQWIKGPLEHLSYPFYFGITRRPEPQVHGQAGGPSDGSGAHLSAKKPAVNCLAPRIIMGASHAPRSVTTVAVSDSVLGRAAFCVATMAYAVEPYVPTRWIRGRYASHFQFAQPSLSGSSGKTSAHSPPRSFWYIVLFSSMM